MGLFSFLFGSAPHCDTTLLRDAEARANETERVYRNQLELVSVIPSGLGLLHARMFAVSFDLAAFWSVRERLDFAIAQPLSGVAWLPFDDPSFIPKCDRQSAVKLASPYIAKTAAGVLHEFEEGPSTPGNRTRGFNGLVEAYHVALAHSLKSRDAYDKEFRARFSPYADGMVWSNLSSCLDIINSLPAAA